MTTAAAPTTTYSIRITKGTIIGYRFGYPMSNKAPITGTVELLADAYIDGARRESDGSWSYDLAPGRTYYCADGLAEVLPGKAADYEAVAFHQIYGQPTPS